MSAYLSYVLAHAAIAVDDWRTAVVLDLTGAHDLTGANTVSPRNPAPAESGRLTDDELIDDVVDDIASSLPHVAVMKSWPTVADGVDLLVLVGEPVWELAARLRAGGDERRLPEASWVLIYQPSTRTLDVQTGREAAARLQQAVRCQWWRGVGLRWRMLRWPLFAGLRWRGGWRC